MTFWERYIKNVKESLIVIGIIGVIFSAFTFFHIYLGIGNTAAIYTLILLLYSPLLLILDLIWAWLYGGGE